MAVIQHNNDGSCDGWIPTRADRMAVVLVTCDEMYRVRLIRHVVGCGQGGRELGWEMQKASTGERHHLRETWELTETGADQVLRCDCKGCEAHGPSCAGGRGCRHARMLRALRQLCDPGL